MPKTIEQLIEQFQCPGCLHGSDTQCGQYCLDTDFGEHCANHRPATFTPFGKVYLGMPKGFNKVGCLPEEWNNNVHIWRDGDKPDADNLNVPVWAMEHEGCLLLRMFSPRIGVHYLHVIEGGTLADYPTAINVADFIDEID